MEIVNNGPGFPGEKENNNSNRSSEINDFCENAVLPLHCVNGSGVIVWANQAEIDFLGYSRDEYINHHVGTFHVDKNIAEDILGRLMKHENLVNYYVRLRTKSGEIKHVFLNSSAVIKDGKFSHTRCFTTDITDLKKAEFNHLCLIAELREKNTRLLWKAGNLKRSA